MRVLLDECVPRKLAAHLPGHHVETVPKAGWKGISDERLLNLSDGDFDVLITVDRNLVFQQNVTNRHVAVLVLAAKRNRLQDLLPLVPQIQAFLVSPPKARVTVLSA